MRDRAKHKVFTRALRRARSGEPVEVPRAALRRLPSSYEETILGTPPPVAVGAGRRQYRGPYGRHVYETPRSWVVHRDSADPRRDPIGHLAVDAPEWGAGILAAGLLGIIAGRSSYERALQRGADRETATRDAVIDGLIVGTMAGLAAFGVALLLKAVFSEN